MEVLGKNMANLNLAGTLPWVLHSGELLVGPLGDTMNAARGCHFWRESARKRFNDLSLLWAYQSCTKPQELRLFAGEGIVLLAVTGDLLRRLYPLHMG